MYSIKVVVLLGFMTICTVALLEVNPKVDLEVGLGLELEVKGSPYQSVLDMESSPKVGKRDEEVFAICWGLVVGAEGVRRVVLLAGRISE
jgi:hypothetical protein